MRLTSEQGSSRVKNLYAFKERMEGGDDDDDDLLSDDDDAKGKGKADDDRKSKGRRK
jgi:hypothetical protein